MKSLGKCFVASPWKDRESASSHRKHGVEAWVAFESRTLPGLRETGHLCYSGWGTEF